jgi:hypothetical protein
MLTLLPPPSWAEIQSQLEDLPPPVAAFALKFLQTARPLPDAALILADAADEAARELDSIIGTIGNYWRDLANTARAAAPLLDRRAAE